MYGYQVSQSFPTPASLAAGRATSKTARIGQAIARDSSAVGIQWSLGPAIDNIAALTEPLDACERFSDDTQTVVRHASAFLEGLTSGGVGPCPITDLTSVLQEVYRSNADRVPDVDELVLREDLHPLRQLIEAQSVDSLLLRTSLEDFADLQKASRCLRLLIEHLLRRRLRYRGLVVLDCSQVNGNGNKCLRHAPLRGLLSGADMVILPYDIEDQTACIQAIHAAAGSLALENSATAQVAGRIRSFKAHSLAGSGSGRPQAAHGSESQQHTNLVQDAYRNATTALSSTTSPLLGLPASSVLVLLTPSVPPLATSTNTSTSDPFERFGRAIAGFHTRTRHVPYTLSAGLTSTHMAFIDRAAAVILVLCNTSSAFTETQVEFIVAIQDHMRACESRPGQPRIRKALLAAGDPRDLNGPLEGWWEVCSYEYTPGALDAAAEVLTGQRRATGCLPVKIGRYLNSS